MKHLILHRLLRVALVAGALCATPALAAGYCSEGLATEGIAVGNVSFEGAAAADCYGVVTGNLNSGKGAAVLNGMNWGTGWTYLDATDAGSANFMGLKFTVTATPKVSGQWTLSAVDTNGANPLNLPASLDFVVGLKAGNEYALWGFDDIVVNGTDSGLFSIVFTNGGGNRPALSHLVVFGRESTAGTVTAVPEAKTYAMLLAGLGLIGFTVRRKLGWRKPGLSNRADFMVYGTSPCAP